MNSAALVTIALLLVSVGFLAGLASYETLSRHLDG
jgi:hypothetical protein